MARIVDENIEEKIEKHSNEFYEMRKNAETIILSTISFIIKFKKLTDVEKPDEEECCK